MWLLLFSNRKQCCWNVGIKLIDHDCNLMLSKLWCNLCESLLNWFHLQQNEGHLIFCLGLNMLMGHTWHCFIAHTITIWTTYLCHLTLILSPGRPLFQGPSFQTHYHLYLMGRSSCNCFAMLCWLFNCFAFWKWPLTHLVLVMPYGVKEFGNHLVR